MAGEEKDCSICAKKEVATEDFVGIPICPDCTAQLGLDEIEPAGQDEELAGMLDPKGLAILEKVTALVRRSPVEFGWKVLSLAPFIGEQVDDRTRKAIMESALVIIGASIVKNGQDEGEIEEYEEKLISLFLILGQYLDLSIMGRISKDEDLSPESYLDEIIMVFEHDTKIFNFLRSLDHGSDPEKKTIVARAMKLCVK